jgi:hypothetical protein
MSRIAGGVIAALLMSQGAAAQLSGLIDQNIKSQRSSYNRVSKEPTKALPQLWIHVQSEEQKQAVQKKLEWFRNLVVGGQKVELRPIQVVTTGPTQSQLRFFRRTGKTEAQALLAEIKKVVPLTVLKDMSTEYQQLTWIEPGHYELWLAPNVTKFAPP